MDPTTAVATSPLLALIAFLGVIFLLLFLIAKWRWHVFLALLIPLLLFGLIPGVQTHLGNFNDLMLAGTLSGVEMGLALARVPHQPGGVQAALAYLARNSQ